MFKMNADLLANCKNDTEVKKLVDTLFSRVSEIHIPSQDWNIPSKALLTATLLYVKDFSYPLNTIEFAFKLLNMLSLKELDAVFINSNSVCIRSEWLTFRKTVFIDPRAEYIKKHLLSHTHSFCDNSFLKCS